MPITHTSQWAHFDVISSDGAIVRKGHTFMTPIDKSMTWMPLNPVKVHTCFVCGWQWEATVKGYCPKCGILQ